MTTDNQSEEPLRTALIDPLVSVSRLPPGPYRLEWPEEQGGWFKVWGRQGTPPDGWAIPLVAMGTQSVMEWLVDYLSGAAPAPHWPTPPVGTSDELREALDWLGKVIDAHTDACPILRTASEGGAETDLDTAFYDLRSQLSGRDDSAPGEAESK